MQPEQEFVGEYADGWVGTHFSIEVPWLKPQNCRFVVPRFPHDFQFPSEGTNHPYDTMTVRRAFKMRVVGRLGPPGLYGPNGRFERELIISEVIDCREVLDNARVSWWRRLFG